MRELVHRYLGQDLSRRGFLTSMAALERGTAATREGSPYVVDVEVARYGGGAESTWHQEFKLAKHRKRRV